MREAYAHRASMDHVFLPTMAGGTISLARIQSPHVPVCGLGEFIQFQMRVCELVEQDSAELTAHAPFTHVESVA